MHKLSFIFFVILTIMVAGCTPTIDSRGYNPDTDNFEKVKVGVSNRDHVYELLGSPSTVSALKGDVWYYISKKTETTSFFTPKVIEEQIVMITFNDQGVVSDIKKYSGESAKAITPVSRETGTSGYDQGVLRQVFSNFGRKGAANKPKTP